MNKRQIKKKKKTFEERIQFFNRHILICGRKNGKTYLYIKMWKACYSKHYKPFKLLKKVYDKYLLSTDLSNVKDYGIMTTAKINKGKIQILKTEIIRE